MVIPTKNRSSLVKTAIRSVLNQSFTDFEVVIADNDDTEQTRRVVENINDQRVRYFRTGRLSMPDNWDFAYSKAEGEYIMLLEDKQLLRVGALQRIHDAIIKNKRPLVISWCYDQLRDDQIPVQTIKAGGTGRSFFISSEEVIGTFLNYGRGGMVGRVLPRGLNSCIHSSLAEQIRSNTPDRRLCLPVAPDYTMAFLQLAFAKNLLHVDEALVVVRGYKYSTGRHFKLKKGNAAITMIQEIGGESLLYNKVPIKAPILSNCLFNDYERVRILVGRRLTEYPINIHNYFFQCYMDIQESKLLGIDMQREEAEWKRVLSGQDKSIQDAVIVTTNLFEFQRQRAEKFKLKLKERDAKIKQLNTKILEQVEKIQNMAGQIQGLEEEVRQQRQRAEVFKKKIKERDKKIKKISKESQLQSERAEKFKAKLIEKRGYC